MKTSSSSTQSMTKKEAVANLLKSRRWYTSTEIDTVAGGTPESGVRAARRLREEGVTLKVRRGPNGTEYRKV